MMIMLGKIISDDWFSANLGYFNFIIINKSLQGSCAECANNVRPNNFDLIKK